MRIYGCPTKTLNSSHFELVKRALELGYTHLDLAAMFLKHRNFNTTFPELKRSEYKVILKVMPGVTIKPILPNFDNFIDIMLVHWPGIYNLKPDDPKNEIERHACYA